MVQLGLRVRFSLLLRLIVLPQVVHHLAIVLVVRELDVLEEELGHRELELVSLLDLLLNLAAQLWHGLHSRFRGNLVHVSVPLSYTLLTESIDVWRDVSICSIEVLLT